MTDKENKMEEPIPNYDKVEIDHLRESLKSSFKERFLMATRLYKIQQTMQKAVITHKPLVDR